MGSKRVYLCEVYWWESKVLELNPSSKAEPSEIIQNEERTIQSTNKNSSEPQCG